MAKLKAVAPSDDLALQYIREKGYASYSSIKHVRDCTNPYEKSDARYYAVGSEVHARWLENQKVEKMTAVEEAMVKGMVASLKAHKMASLLRADAECEFKIDKKLNGVPFIGYIDIQKPKYLADLKTYGHTNEPQFLASQDFLQPAIYLKASGRKDFFYIGVSKTFPYKVCTYSVLHYKPRLVASQKELAGLLRYVKKKLF